MKSPPPSKFAPIAKKAPVKLWQVPTEPHVRAEAPHTHKTYACKATAATTYIIQLFFILHNCLYHEQIVTFSFAQKTSYSDHQRIGHRRVFPFFTFLTFIQLQTWYNFIPCEHYQKECSLSAKIDFYQKRQKKQRPDAASRCDFH